MESDDKLRDEKSVLVSASSPPSSSLPLPLSGASSSSVAVEDDDEDQLYGVGVLLGRRARPQEEEDDDKCRLDAEGDRAGGLLLFLPLLCFLTTSLGGTDDRRCCRSGASEWTERRPETAPAPPVQSTEMCMSDALRLRLRRRCGRVLPPSTTTLGHS